VVSLPAQDRTANRLRRILPVKWAYTLSRWKNIAYMMYMYQLAQRYPKVVKAGILKKAQAELGPGCDAATHFSPRYNPWQQRLCVAPDGDFVRAIRSGRATVVTDETEEFTADGIRLKSGKCLEADIVVTATGLVLQTVGGVANEHPWPQRRSRPNARLQRRNDVRSAESRGRLRLPSTHHGPSRRI
jgi:monooxygenase